MAGKKIWNTTNRKYFKIVGNKKRNTYNEEKRPIHDFITSIIGSNQFPKSSAQNELFERITENLVDATFYYDNNLKTVKTYSNRKNVMKLIKSKSSTRYENVDYYRNITKMIKYLEYIIKNFIYLLDNNLVIDYAIQNIEDQITLLYRTINILTPPDKEAVYLGNNNLNQTMRNRNKTTRKNGRNNGRNNRRKNRSGKGNNPSKRNNTPRV